MSLAKNPEKFAIYLILGILFFHVNMKNKWVFGHNPEKARKFNVFCGQKFFQKWAAAKKLTDFWPIFVNFFFKIFNFLQKPKYFWPMAIFQKCFWPRILDRRKKKRDSDFSESRSFYLNC